MPSSGKDGRGHRHHFLTQAGTGRAAHHVDPDWLGVAPIAIEGREIPVNRYFLNHPEMVLGTWSRKDTLYGGEGYSVLGNGDLAGQLKDSDPPPSRICSDPGIGSR